MTSRAGSSMLIHLGVIDYCLLCVYFAFVLGIGFVVKKGVSGTKDFFESGRALPAWICALGFIGANLGAQEVSDDRVRSIPIPVQVEGAPRLRLDLRCSYAVGTLLDR